MSDTSTTSTASTTNTGSYEWDDVAANLIGVVLSAILSANVVSGTALIVLTAVTALIKQYGTIEEAYLAVKDGDDITSASVLAALKEAQSAGSDLDDAITAALAKISTGS